MPDWKLRLRRLLLNRHTAFLLFMFAYTWALELAGGMSSLATHWYIEGPLLLYLYALIHHVSRPGGWRPLVAALPFVMLYGMFDAYFMAFGQVFRVNQFHNLPALLQVMPTAQASGMLLLLASPLLIVLWRFDWRKSMHAVAGIAPAVLLAVATQAYPEQFVTAFDDLGTDVVPWSDATSVEHAGRFAMLMYFEADRNASLLRSSAYRDRDRYDSAARSRALALRAHMNRRNVHLVVLESFLDPTLFSLAKYSRDPRHPDYVKLFGDKLGFSISPVFGGGTAQAEFEALCGVPAYGSLSTIEFNAFTGAPARCLPDILAQAGYRTLATNAYKPDFFNAINAYNGAGFGEIYFPAEFARSRTTYLSTGDVSADEKYMFDGTLFEQNLKFVETALRQHPDRPIFNYVLSIYGHFPHHIDTQKRPHVLSLAGKDQDDPLSLAANQHYYRTQAIAHYVHELMRLDPHSLIVLVSDHVPPLDGFDSYRQLGYLSSIDDVEDAAHYNRIAIVENGKVVRYPTIHHYDIASLIYNYLTDGRYCRFGQCNLARTTRQREDYHEDYMRLMAHAVDSNFQPAVSVAAKLAIPAIVAEKHALLPSVNAELDFGPL